MGISVSISLFAALLVHHHRYTHANATQVSDSEFELLTYEVKPYISGIRVLGAVPNEGFIGYSDAGISLVHPDTRVRVVLFGYHLDAIAAISFTVDNCFNSLQTISHPDFLTHTMKRLDFMATFKESDEPYRICYKEKNGANGPDSEDEDMIMLDEMRTWVQTDTPVHICYLPTYLQLSIILVLFMLSGLFSGLNLGLMALSPQELMLIQKSGSTTERKYAETILPVRRTGNYLLCTILIMNVVVNAAISILFEDMTSGILAFVLASFGIVVMGEIVPQSICVKKGLAVGARTIWLTRAFMILTFPLSYPISKVLDIFLGETAAVYDRAKLINLMKMTTSEENKELAADLKIAVGAMEFFDKKVKHVLTHIEDVFMVSENLVLNSANIAAIIRRGCTRIPVHKDGDRNTVVSLLMIKDLALIDPNDSFTVHTVCQYHKHPLCFVDENQSLDLMLNEFKKGNYHLAIVERQSNTLDPKTGEHNKEIIGVVTLEDIVEEILQAEIIDESDAITDNVYRRKRKNRKNPDAGILLLGEEVDVPLSSEMQVMASHWLTHHHNIFSGAYVDKCALNLLLRQNLRKVDLSYTAQRYESLDNEPTTVYLIKKEEPSHRFIVILEGRATVHFERMTFEVGPWSSFGDEILDQMSRLTRRQRHRLIAKSSDVGCRESIISDRHNSDIGDIVSSIQYIPDFDLTVSGYCRFLQVTVSAYAKAYRETRLIRSSNNKGVFHLQWLVKTPHRSKELQRRFSGTLAVQTDAKRSSESLPSSLLHRDSEQSKFSLIYTTSSPFESNEIG